MKFLAIIALSSLVASCSNLKRTLVYSSLAGGMTGAVSGYVLSPNKEIRGANAAVFGLIGAGVAALAGSALYEDDPRNYKLKNMLRDKKEINPNEIELGSKRRS